jgi:hypothetical protein
LANECEERSKEKPATLYHYTNAAGLLGIVGSNRLWATHTAYLNDKLEVKYAADLIDAEIRYRLDKDVTESTRELLTRMLVTYNFSNIGISAYVACLCEKGDLLSQWRGYGAQGAGFALGMKTKYIGMYGVNRQAERDFILRRVIYSEARQRDIVSKYFDAFIELFDETLINLGTGAWESLIPAFCQGFRNAAFELLVTFKHPAFEQEHEWRVIFLDRIGADNGLESVKFRPSANFLVPYVEVDISAQAGGGANKLPLAEVIVGPTGNPDLSVASMKMFLRKNDFAFTEVGVSGVPLR